MCSNNLSLAEKFDQERRRYCFYLDVQDQITSRLLSKRIQDMGLQQEAFLTPRVTHVIRYTPPVVVGGGAVAASAGGGGGAAGGGGGGGPRCLRREAGRARVDAMLERVRHTHQPTTKQDYVLLSVPRALKLLDCLYETYVAPARYVDIAAVGKDFIKIEFLDKVCRPVFKHISTWPEFTLEQDPPRDSRLKVNNITNISKNHTYKPAEKKMTRKSRPRIREKEENEVKGGFCEMCNCDYVDVAQHCRSQRHAAFVREPNNFLALDSLIRTGADVATFLEKASSVNGERRSLRNMCNGDVEPPKSRRSKRSQSPDTTVNGDQSPKCNGEDDERKHNTRCSSKKSSESQVSSQVSEDRQYYKVVGVSTKLRSSGGFANKKKDSTTACNGTKPIVVKFRKVRRSELSVLSDEAEQFMFPKRASSTSSSSSDDSEKVVVSPKRKSPPQPPQPLPQPALERRRLARPLALKEESSEEDSWAVSKQRRKRRGPPVAKRARRAPIKATVVAPESDVVTPPVEPVKPVEAIEAPPPEVEANPLREEPMEKCMKWEDGKLKYTPAVEQLEFAFESVPQTEPWYEAFLRQDQDKVLTKNVPQYFSLYSKSPKLPYEIGQLPPLKPNCCPLSDLVKRDEKPGPSRSYGTRGMKKQKIRKRTAALIALEAHPRKSPREHASTLAILGSAGLLHRRKHADDTKSTASEDTASDTHSNVKMEPVVSETQVTSERLQQFLSEVFDDANEYDVPDDVMEGEQAITTSTNVPDVLNLVSESEICDMIRNEIKVDSERPKGRRGKFKKKNRTGWPKKKKQVKKEIIADSAEGGDKVESSLDRSSAEPLEDDTTIDTISEEDTNLSETDHDATLTAEVTMSADEMQNVHVDLPNSQDAEQTMDEKSLQIDVKVCLQDKDKEKSPLKEDVEQVEKKAAQPTASDTEEKEDKSKKKKRSLQGLGGWLQPVVRVARVDPSVAGRLRSAAGRAGRTRGARFR